MRLMVIHYWPLLLGQYEGIADLCGLGTGYLKSHSIA